MKIFVTGHRGFIGKNLTKRLQDIGHELVLYEWGDKFPDISTCDYVIHLGAISSTTEKNVEKIMEQNYDFSCDLLQQCITHDIPMQFASSASIYGKNKEFNENSPVDPITPYAWSKYMFERYAKKYMKSNTIQIFRYFNVYGPNEYHKGNQASPYTQFEIQAKETGIIKIFEGSDNYYRDFVHVDTVINTHITMFNTLESGIWNIGSGNAKSFKQVAEEIANIYNCSITTIPFPEHLKTSYQMYTKADIQKLNETIKFIDNYW